MSSSPRVRSRSSFIRIPVLVRGAVAVTLLAIGMLIFGGLASSRPEPKRVEADVLVRRVTFFEIEPAQVARQWTGYGTVRALRSADVPARITAVVTERPEGIERGSFVRAGTLLIGLDDIDVRQQVEVSIALDRELAAREAELQQEERGLAARLAILSEQDELASREAARARDALTSGAATDREVEAAEQALNRVRLERSSAEESAARIPARRALIEAQRTQEAARRRLAEEQLARTRITAPIDGIVQELDAEFGEQVMAGSRIARIVDGSRVEVALRLPASARQLIRTGDEVQLRTVGPMQQVWTARVDRISPEDDAQTRTMRVFAVLEAEGPEGQYALPVAGQFMRGEVTATLRETRTVVPRRAIEGDRIMTVDAEGRLVGRRIEVDFQIERTFPATGLADVAWSVLRDDLPPGTRVIAQASRRYFDGMRVEAVEAGREAPLTRGAAADDRAVGAPRAEERGGQ